MWQNNKQTAYMFFWKQKHAEDYQKTANKQLLVLPSIEDVQKKKVQIPKW